MAGKPKFNRIPQVQELIRQGVAVEVIATYAALSDYADNKTGFCFPKMETLAKTLQRSVRTIQRHLHLLRELGLIQFVERRRNAGRFSSYLYRITFFLSTTTGHERPQAKPRPIKRRTRRSVTPPNSPPKEAFNWFFGKERDLEAEEEHGRRQKEKRKQEAKRRREGYEWLFG